MHKVAASIMCSNQLYLQNELQHLEKAQVDLLHCDVMDGKFVENLAMGFYVLEAIKSATSIPLDIHLATETPMKYIHMFAPIQPEYMSFHVEASEDVAADIALLHKYKIKPVLAISPQTPISAIIPYLTDIEMVLFMTVNPGFAGQTFKYEVMDKLDQLIEVMQPLKDKPLIEVDGNINEQTIPPLVEKGANVFVLGTSQLFNENKGTYSEKVKKVKRLFKNI